MRRRGLDQHQCCAPGEPRPSPVAPTTHAECLACSSRAGSTVNTDDTLLAGFKAQDPNVAIVGERLTSRHYGLGLPPQRDPVGALRQRRAGGRALVRAVGRHLRPLAERSARRAAAAGCGVQRLTWLP